jgi:serine/threonine protein kinase
MAQLKSVLDTHLARYEMYERVGSGGMATVFRALDTNLGRDVALKALHEHLVHEATFRERFEREARFIAGFNHPNIVQIYDFDVLNVDGTHIYYMVMPFVSGDTLKAVLEHYHSEEKTLPHARIIQIVEDIASALDYAHERGMVHRDVKPANILFDEHERAILTDFGIARLARSSGLTQDGTIVGTPAYMSPEQATGQESDLRSDIYSLAVIVYEMLTGRLPFDDDGSVSVLVKHANETPPDITSVLPHLSEAINECVLKALEKDPSRRYDSAGAFAASLVSTLKEQSTTQRLRPATVLLTSTGSSGTNTETDAAIEDSEVSQSTRILTTLTTTVLKPVKQNPMGLVALVVALVALLLVARVAQNPTTTTAPMPEPAVRDVDDSVTSMTSDNGSGAVDSMTSMTDMDEPFFFSSDFNADDDLNPYWQQTESGTITRRMDDGTYVFTINERRTAATALFDPVYTYDDVSIMLQGTISEDSADETSAMGIVFRYQDAQNYNVFAVDGAGQFSIWRLEDGAWFELRDPDDPWTEDEAINPIGEVNSITLSIYNDSITAWVNDEPVVMLEESTFDGGGVGVYAASTQAGQTVATVETFSVQEASTPSMTDDG